MALIDHKEALNKWAESRLEGWNYRRRDWDKAITAHIEDLGTTYDFEPAPPVRPFYNLKDLGSSMEAILKLSEGKDHGLQLLVQLCLGLHLGPMSSSILLNKHYPHQILRWEDVDFWVHDGLLLVTIRLLWTKGRRDPYLPGYKSTRTPSFVFAPADAIEALPADLTVLLPILAMARGRLRLASFEELEAYIQDPQSKAHLPTNQSLNTAPIFLQPSLGSVSFSQTALGFENLLPESLSQEEMIHRIGRQDEDQKEPLFIYGVKPGSGRGGEDKDENLQECRKELIRRLEGFKDST